MDDCDTESPTGVPANEGGSVASVTVAWLIISTSLVASTGVSVVDIIGLVVVFAATLEAKIELSDLDSDLAPFRLSILNIVGVV